MINWLPPWNVWWFWQVFTKKFKNGKLNFCSAGMSQEAFLPHVNGVAARHFWKRRKDIDHSEVCSWKRAVIRGQSADEKVTETTQSLHEGNSSARWPLQGGPTHTQEMEGCGADSLEQVWGFKVASHESCCGLVPPAIPREYNAVLENPPWVKICFRQFMD